MGGVYQLQNATKINSQENPINTSSYPREVTIASMPLKYANRNNSLKSKTGPLQLPPPPPPPPPSFLLLSASGATVELSTTATSSSSSSTPSGSLITRQKRRQQLNKTKLENFDTSCSSSSSGGGGGGHVNNGFDYKQQNLTTTTLASEINDNESSNSTLDLGNFTILSSSNDSSNMANLVNTNTNATNGSKGKINLRRESSQLLPQSIVSQMAKNFQSLAYFNQNKNSNHFSGGLVEQHKNNSQILLNNNFIEQQQQQQQTPLRDEDAWLPILNLVEEQVCYFICVFFVFCFFFEN
jgi:hypothetical protein